MNEPRDTLVGDALRRLDVPDHAPDFWDRLDASLSAPAASAWSDGADPDADATGDDDLGADVIELGAARADRAALRTRPARLPAVAAAAAAVAAIALAVGLPAAQQAADGDRQIDVAGAPEESPDPSAPVTSEPIQTTPAPKADTTPEGVATEWLTLLRDGEVEAAHALLDETSREALPLDAFRELASGLAEGAGSFAGLEPTVVPLMDDEGLAATVVVFTGDVTREGMVETASYPVVVTGDPESGGRAHGVAFVLDGPTVEAVQRTQPSETRTSPLELDVSPTAGATWAVVDGGDPVRIDSGEPTVTVDVEGIAGAGTHTVVVVSTEAGRYTARAFTVVVP